MKMWLNGVCKRVLTSACGAWPGLLSRFEKAVWHVRFGAWRKQQTATIVEWREPVFERLLQSGDADGPIDYLEYGVFEGKTLRWWVNRNRDPASRFVGFDTFTGLPADWEWAPKGFFSTQGKLPVFDDPRCRLVVGLFQDTLPSFLAANKLERRTVVHLDADLYSSTLFVLMQIGPHLRRGDIIVFDEFSIYMHEFRAWCNFLEAFPIRYEVLVMTPDAAQVAIRVA